MSAMFDEWAYHEVFEPQSPPRHVTVQPDVELASEQLRNLTVNIPDPVLRSRASTAIGIPDVVRGDKDESHQGNVDNKVMNDLTDVPLTKLEDRQLWRVDKWLGAADLSVYDFDPAIWEAEMQEFTNAQLSAKIASRLSNDAYQEALALGREIEWILHELDDTKSHDLASLNLVLSETTFLNERKEEAQIVRQIINDIWDAYDQAARILRGPAPKAIPHLASILEQAQRARKFCKDHPDFVGIVETEQSWRHSTQRAIAIALAYTSHELWKVTMRISANVKESSGGAGAVQALIHAKFEADASALIPHIALLRTHSATAPEPELQLGWGDLQNIYFQLRTSLAGTQIAKLAQPLDKFTNITDEFEETCRTSLVQFRQLYLAEEQLFLKLFGPPTTDQFWEWLSDSSDPLYATLRRVILHETDIGRLCQLIVLVSEEPEESVFGFDTKESRLAGTNGIQERVAQPTHTVSPLEAVHKDAQYRLMFRANLAVDELSRHEAENKDFLRARFPTVEQSLELLGQVYQILSSEVFNDLAHRCVRECLSGLDRAVANRVAANESDMSIHLYHIKQLLILQSQIVEFDLRQTVVQEVDFSGIQNLLRSYRERVTFRELVSAAWDSVPKVVETMFDAMEEIFSSLRRAVDRLCRAFTGQLDFKKMSKSTEKNNELREDILKNLSDLKSVIASQISDNEVQTFLLDSIQEAIMDSYTLEYRKLNSGALESESVMDIDTMSAWLSSSIV